VRGSQDFVGAQGTGAEEQPAGAGAGAAAGQSKLRQKCRWREHCNTVVLGDGAARRSSMVTQPSHQLPHLHAQCPSIIRLLIARTAWPCIMALAAGKPVKTVRLLHLFALLSIARASSVISREHIIAAPAVAQGGCAAVLEEARRGMRAGNPAPRAEPRRIGAPEQAACAAPAGHPMMGSSSRAT